MSLQYAAVLRPSSIKDHISLAKWLILKCRDLYPLSGSKVPLNKNYGSTETFGYTCIVSVQ